MSVPDVCRKQSSLELFAPHVPMLAKLEVTALRYEYARAPMESPPGVAGVSGSGCDLRLCLSLPSTAEELLPACACQVVVCNHLNSPCSRDSEVPERTETTPETVHPGCMVRPAALLRTGKFCWEQSEQSEVQ